MSQVPRLLQRATAREVKRASTMAASLSALDAAELVTEYQEAMETAPRRSEEGYPYLRERSGRPPQSENETRREERLAMALVNDEASIAVGNETIDMLMYAFPLYTSGGPRGIRAVDLVGHASETRRFWVGELKVAAKSGYGETPLRALYEALIYGAVVEASMAAIAREVAVLDRKIEHLRPGVLIAAPTEYWERWTPNSRIGDWWSPYRSITETLSVNLETPVETVDLGRISYRIELDSRPRIAGHLDCQNVRY